MSPLVVKMGRLHLNRLLIGISTDYEILGYKNHCPRPIPGEVTKGVVWRL